MRDQQPKNVATFRMRGEKHKPSIVSINSSLNPVQEHDKIELLSIVLATISIQRFARGIGNHVTSAPHES